jgi:hypothetical protein
MTADHHRLDTISEPSAGVFVVTQSIKLVSKKKKYRWVLVINLVSDPMTWLS